MARYSMLKDNNRLFQAKYMTFLPSKEELTNEIERQKMIFRLQQENKRKFLKKLGVGDWGFEDWGLGVGSWD